MAKRRPDFGQIQITNEKLERELSALKAELASLREITTLMATALEAQPVFEKVLDQAMTLTGASSGSLMLIEDQVLYIVASRGLDKAVAESSRPRLGEGVAGWVAERGQPLLLVGPGSRGRTGPKRRIKDALSVPILIGDDPLGVLNVSNSPAGRQFSRADLDLLAAFAGQAAVALQILHAREETENAFLSVIQALAEAIDAKDPYTSGHSRRVSDYAAHLARLMKLGRDEIDLIKLAALLHDLGKIGVSEDVLRKPVRLDRREYGMIRAHPAISAKILEPMPSLKKAIPIIRHHHEQYDGSGYPAGLNTEEIPLGARILAVVDAFDALASGRAYRPVMSLDDIIKELRSQRKKQFDPQILDVFIRGLKSGRIPLDAAVIVGQEFQAPPMTTDEAVAFVARESEAVIGVIQLMTERLLERLTNMTGRKLADKLADTLEMVAVDTNIYPILPTTLIRSPLRSERLYRDCRAYVKRLHDLLIDIVGVRLAERLLIEVSLGLDETGRRLMLTLLSDLGIELPPPEKAA